jgi:hypothetical protein
MKKGLTVHFFPAPEDDHDMRLVMFDDTWEDGTCTRSEMFIRETVDIDLKEITGISREGFALLACEIASQLLENQISTIDLYRINGRLAAMTLPDTPSTPDM